MRRCPLCCSEHCQLHIQDKKRAFFLCSQCQLIFADPQSHLLPQIEQQRFKEADNANKQQQHVQFMQSLISQLTHLAQKPLEGLNFGRIIDEKNLININQDQHKIYQFNPFISPQHDELKRQYDFISCYRVFEHFKNPAKEWQLITLLLKQGGWLAISTPLLVSIDAFSKWHYKNNLTHVSFYQELTFTYLASQGDFSLIYANDDFILMQKTSGSAITRP